MPPLPRFCKRSEHKAMEKITSFITYAMALFLAWLGKLSPQDIAFLVGAAVGIGTFLVNWYYRRKSLQILKAIERNATSRRNIYDECNR
uniref:Phage-holin analog protein n=2 Tax=Serratia marcescens TaxID=615 RepID=Q54422_SERMA|nr:phage-holin analog protein [Serratia marcescens]